MEFSPGRDAASVSLNFEYGLPDQRQASFRLVVEHLTEPPVNRRAPVRAMWQEHAEQCPVARALEDRTCGFAQCRLQRNLCDESLLIPAATYLAEWSSNLKLSIERRFAIQAS